MLKLISDHLIISILVTIVLGSISAGLWEWAVKPLVLKFSRMLFVVMTFGTKKASDRIYSQAAKGHHEKASIKAYMFIVVIIFTVPLGFSLGLLMGSKSENVNLYINKGKTADTNIEQHACVGEKKRESITEVLPYLILFNVLVIIFYFYNILVFVQVNAVVTQFNQSIKIFKPYIESDAVIKLESMYARMSTKEDYDKIIAEIKSINKNLDIPKISL